MHNILSCTIIINNGDSSFAVPQIQSKLWLDSQTEGKLLSQLFHSVIVDNGNADSCVLLIRLNCE